MTRDRNNSIEAFRAFMMLIVCSYHALVCCDHNVVWLNHALLVGVVGLLSLVVGLGFGFLGEKYFTSMVLPYMVLLFLDCSLLLLGMSMV